MLDHVLLLPPWQDQPYSVKRHGVTITNCDAEPVHTPGCIQAHGALLVLRRRDLIILQASENVAQVLGHSLTALLGQPMTATLGPLAEDRLRQLLAGAPSDDNPVYLMTVPGASEQSLDLTAQTHGSLVILEFEATGRTASPDPSSFDQLKHSIARLQPAQTLAQFCTLVTQEVRRMTGMDRVMVYKFHPDGHGEVVAETHEGALTPWLGLHYPAGDIPGPAREIFKRVWIRPVPDITDEPAELVPLLNPETGQPLDMAHCALRAPSVMYTEYLRNMRVTACLTLAIRRGSDLWGLIACHHYAGPKPIPYPVRAACELFAQMVSLQHEAAEDREHAAYRARIEGVHQRLLTRTAQVGGLGPMTEVGPGLLDGLAATGAALYHNDRWWTVGATPSLAQLDGLAGWLERQPALAATGNGLYVTDSLSAEYPPADEFADVASGVVAFPLSRSRRSLVLWFRPETIHTLAWAGNPDDKPSIPGPHGMRLTPRHSFELFTQSVQRRARPWHKVELEAAAHLRVMLMESMVTRSEELARSNVDLLRSNQALDAFAYIASHDLKEPLRGIHRYASQLLEGLGEPDGNPESKLAGLMRLTQRMDSLLDSLLHYSRVGQDALEREELDLNVLLGEAIEMVASRISDTASAIVAPRPLPAVRCDPVCFREILVNLLSNALKYNKAPAPRVEVGYLSPDDPALHQPPQLGTGSGWIYYVRDNGIGIEEQHFGQIFGLFKRLHGREEYGGGTGAGLAIVKRLVEVHSGQVWLQSRPGAGTTVYFTLPERPAGLQ